MTDVAPQVTRVAFDKARRSGAIATSFGQHLDALVAFLCAASGHPRFAYAPDDCCDRCGAPERAFRATLRLLHFQEKP